MLLPGSSSEGSLTQHLKIKHPDYFAKIGLTQLSVLKDFDEFKSLASDDKGDEESKDSKDPPKELKEKGEESTKKCLN